MKMIYRYHITYFNEFTENDETSNGILMANSYQDAVDKLMSVELGYGGNHIDSITIHDCDEEVITDEDLKIELERY